MHSYKEAQYLWLAPVAEFRQAGRSSQAEAYLKQALDRYHLSQQLQPWKLEFRLAQARVHVELADLLDARNQGQSTIQNQPRRDAGADDEGIAREEHYRSAIDVATKAKSFAGRSPLPDIVLARSYRAQGDRSFDPQVREEGLDRALAHYSAAAELAPGWPEVLDEAALTARLAGRPQEATELAREAIELDPYYRRAWRSLGSSYSMLEDWPAAAAAYRAYFVDYRNLADEPALRALLTAQRAAGSQEDEIRWTLQQLRLVAPGDPEIAQELDARARRRVD